MDLTATIKATSMTHREPSETTNCHYQTTSSATSSAIGETQVLILEDNEMIKEMINLTDEPGKRPPGFNSCSPFCAADARGYSKRVYVESVPRLKELYRKKPHLQTKIVEAVDLMLDFARDHCPSQEHELIAALMQK